MPESRICLVCNSLYRKEIEQHFIKPRIPTRYLFAKYAPLMGYKGSIQNFSCVLNRHKKHYRNTVLVLNKESVEHEDVDIELIVKRIREIYWLKLRTTPEDQLKKEIGVKDLYGGEKVLLDIKKLKMQENALESMMAKLFGPAFTPITVIEGEMVGIKSDDKLQSGQTPAIQPKNP